MKIKAFISQPMRGKNDEDIKKERDMINVWCKARNYDVIDTIFDFGDESPIYYLAKSIEAMSKANIVIFMNGREEARGCRIEYEVAKAYGKEIMILSDINK